MLYHAWSRLYAHAASLNAVERVSAAAAAAKDLEKDAATTVPIIKKLKKESAGEQMTHTRRRAKQVVRPAYYDKCSTITILAFVG